MSFWSYYRAAVPRSAVAGWRWARGQGLYLSILLAVGVRASAIAFAVIRVLGGRDTWQNAVSAITRAFVDFAGAGLIATAIVLFIAFMVFFVQDAPNQIRIRDERIAQLGGAPDAPIAVPHLSRSERAR